MTIPLCLMLTVIESDLYYDRTDCYKVCPFCNPSPLIHSYIPNLPIPLAVDDLNLSPWPPTHFESSLRHIL